MATMKPSENELLDALIDVLHQSCYDEDDRKLDSRAISAYRDGLMLLARVGLFTVEHHHGRRVIGVWNQEAIANFQQLPDAVQQ